MRSRRAVKGVWAVALLMGVAGCSLTSAPEPEVGGDGVVTIMYGFTDSSSEHFQADVQAFADSQGISVRFEPTPDFNTTVSTRISNDQVPDIAIFPQPGVMRSFGSDLVPLEGLVDRADLDAMVPGIAEAGQIDGEQYAVPMSLNVKSVVFYPKPAFEAAGYAVPTTLDELQQLSDQVRADGTAPWCFGVEDGSATGWPVTDWVENLLLVQSGPEVYRQWVAHEIPFNDPAALQAADAVERLVLADGHVLGGRAALASTGFARAGDPMFTTPPGCYLFRQGNFVARSGGFPDPVLADLDDAVGVFGVPGLVPEDRPVLGGGDLAAAFTDTDDVRAVLGHLASADFGTEWAAANGFISPRTDFDLAAYPNEVTRQLARTAYGSTSFVFDGSDQMPGEVGSGAFWREGTRWVSGAVSAEDAFAAVEESWPPQ